MGTSRLTILFEDPFWIGLYEREDDTGYAVCRIVFGGEPRDQEVYAYLLEHWRTLRFSPPRPADDRPDAPKRPKRRQREARQATRTGGIGTKAQQALQLQREPFRYKGSKGLAAAAFAFYFECVLWEPAPVQAGYVGTQYGAHGPVGTGHLYAEFSMLPLFQGTAQFLLQHPQVH